MFLSINKKIIYTISIFSIFIGIILTYSFYRIYFNDFMEKQQEAFNRNNQYISYLQENIVLKNAIIDAKIKDSSLYISPSIQSIIGNKEKISEQQQELTEERLAISEFSKTYSDRYSLLKEAANSFIVTSSSIIILLIILWLLLKYWVVEPINRMSEVSSLVAKNNFSTRIKSLSPKGITNEFHNLYKTFNSMLDNIEHNIAEIEAQKRFLQALIDAIPDGIRVIDKDANIIVANKQYYKQVAKTEDQIMQKCYASSHNLSHMCPQSEVRCPLHEIMNNKEKNTKTIQTFANNPKHFLAINSAPLITEYNESKREFIVESIRDLSEDIRFSHQQKLSSIGFLASSVAHEMKNNLGAVRVITEGLLEKLKKDAVDKNKITEFLELINSQIIESINVPERLLKLSRIKDGQLSTINCFDNITDVIKLLDYEATSKGITLSINSPDNNVAIKAAEAEFKIIIINILQNAIKAIGQNGKVDINVAQSDNTALISITDNGHGIEENNIKYIFDPFYSDGRSMDKNGTGLGLAIVKSIVEKFCGEITVNSKVNIGTTFELKFPLEKKDLHK